MYLTKTINLSIYDCKVQIIISSDARNIVNKLYKKHNSDMTYEHHIAGMMFTMAMNKYYFILDINHLTYNTVLHELYHLTQSISSDRNIYEEESRAWIQGLIGQEIFNFLKLKKIHIG